MPAAAAALMLTGIAGQTFAGIQAAKGQEAAAEAEAAAIREQAAFEEAQTRRAAARVMAKGRAIGAASGVDISTGSPLLLDLENARQAELEALNIRRTGELAARAKTFEAQLAHRSIPGIVFGGLAQGGSVLADWTRKAPRSTPAPKSRFGIYGNDFHVRGPGGGMGPV